MKKSIRLLMVLAAVIILALTGCGGSSTPVQEASGKESTASESTVPETEFTLIEEEDLEAGITETESIETEKEETETGKTGSEESETTTEEPSEGVIHETDTPTEKDELAAYIHQFGHLPDNFITKEEAKKLGWVSTKGNLWDVAPGCCIGGDKYSNYEGTLPDAPGRKYYECDVDYAGGYRDAKRIVFSNDGLVYYTDDHYETFELLYGEE